MSRNFVLGVSAVSAAALLLLAATGVWAASVNESLNGAVHQGNPIMVRHWLAQGGDPNWNVLPRMLGAASEKGHVEVVRMLLDAGAQVDAKDEKTRTALMYAAQGGHGEVVKALLAKGANPNARNDYPREYFRLHGSSPHTYEDNQVSALMYAAAGGYTEVATILVAAGAKVNAKAYYEETALMFAAAKGHTGTVLKLLDLGADLHANAEAKKRYAAGLSYGSGGTALVYALREKRIETAKVLVAEYARQRKAIGDGNTVFTYALFARDLDLVRTLADYNGIDSRKPSVLPLAAQVSTPEIVKFLHDRVPQQGIREGRLDPGVLTRAAGSGDLAKVKLLVEGGANLNARDERGQNALYYAVYKGAEDVAAYLIDRGIEVNVIGNTSLGWGNMGDTALAMAVQKGGVETVGRLLAKGADIHLKRGGGKSALQVADELGRTDVLLQFAAAGRIPADSLPVYVRGKVLYRPPATIDRDLLYSSGEKLYAGHCAANCHLADGRGLDARRSLRQARLQGKPKAALVAALLQGVQEQNYTLMEEYGSRMLDADAAALLTYLGSAWGNNLGLDFQPQDIAAARVARPTRAQEPLARADSAGALQQLAKLGYLYTENLFVEAVRRNDRQAVELFLSAGMSPAARDARGITAPYVSASTDNAAILALLLDRGADLHAVNSPWAAGQSAPVAAVTWPSCGGKGESLRLMLDRGLDPNYKRNQDQTLLIHAIRDNCTVAAQILIERGADVNARLYDRQTALSLAKTYKRESLIPALLAAGAKE